MMPGGKERMARARHGGPSGPFYEADFILRQLESI